MAIGAVKTEMPMKSSRILFHGGQRDGKGPKRQFNEVLLHVHPQNISISIFVVRLASVTSHFSTFFRVFDLADSKRKVCLTVQLKWRNSDRRVAQFFGLNPIRTNIKRMLKKFNVFHQINPHSNRKVRI